MKKTKPPYIKLLLIPFVAIPLIWYFTSVHTRREHLYNHGQYTSGYIIKAHEAYANRSLNLTVEYIYYVNGAQYHSKSTSLYMRPHSEQAYLSKWLPVIYNADNPAENVMLLTPGDFEVYQRAVPDSLRWIYAWEDQ